MSSRNHNDSQDLALPFCKSTDISLTKAKGAKEAERAAEALADQIDRGVAAVPDRMSWDAFVERYEREHLAGLAAETGNKYRMVLRRAETILNPKTLSGIDSQWLGYFVTQLRESKLSDSTIRSYLGQLRAMMSWAVDAGMLRSMPKFPKVQRAKRSAGSTPHRGRAITREELERMQLAAVREFGRDKAKPWQDYLEALWLSGLRLMESLTMSWDESGMIRVVVEKRGRSQTARLRIEAEAQKNNTDQLLPLSPEFSEWLLSIPQAERTGYVFNLPGMRARTEQRSKWVGKVVAKLGRKAGVIVSQVGGTKYASAHNMRRSFGDRWAELVMPAVLQQLMRHRSIETALRYYVGKQAGSVEDACERALRQRETASNQPDHHPAL